MTPKSLAAVRGVGNDDMRSLQTLARFAFQLLAIQVVALFASAAQSQPIVTHPLAKQKNCGGCHAENSRIAGPSWAAIRGRYNNLDSDYLVQKILQGGSGAWGALPKPRMGGSSKFDVNENEAQILVAAIGLPQGSQPTVAAPAPAPRPAAPIADDPKVFGRSARGG
jgi:cytochrome c